MPEERAIIGKVVAHYRVLRLLGEGGMGVVFEAEDLRLGRRVAVKFLGTRASRTEDARSRFRREARTASQLNHPNICTVYDFGEAEGRPFIVMELLRGEPLSSRLGNGPLPPAEFFRVAEEVGGALRLAHERGVIHRDVKPANIFLTRDRAKVVDFGLASRRRALFREDTSTLTTESTMPGLLMGTVPYMSPEQLRGERVDHRSDIFSLGVVLFEMATGARPFGADSGMGVAAAILTAPPRTPRSLHPDLPTSLEKVILRSLEKDRDRRYASVAELLDHLRSVRASLGDPDTLRTSWPRVSDTAPAGVEVATPIGWVRDTPLVGRESEREQISAALQRALAGRGSVVLIWGEPGIGKTRLGKAVQDDARSLGCLCLTGHCYEMEGSPPAIPFVEILEGALSEIGSQRMRTLLEEGCADLVRLAPRLRNDFPHLSTPPDLPPERERWQLFGAYSTLLERMAQDLPLLLFLEDLHWADASSLNFLRFLAPRLSEMPVLLIGTLREGAQYDSEHLQEALEDILRRRLALQLTLDRLSEPQVDSMVKALLGREVPPRLRAAVFQWSEGNPFFVEEIVQHLLEEGILFDSRGNLLENPAFDHSYMSKTIEFVIRRRIDRLGPATRKTLAAAAVLGRQFDLSLLEQVAGGDEPDRVLEAVEEGEQARILTAAPAGGELRYHFAHALIRQAFLQSISARRLQRLHLAAAGAIEGVFRRDLTSHITDLAFHLKNAGDLADPAKTADYLEKAGRLALKASAFDDAIRLLRDGIDKLRVLPDSPERTQKELELQLTLASPLSVVRGFGSSDLEKVYDRARLLCRQVGRTPPSFVALLWRFYIIRGNLASARETADRFLDEAFQQEDALTRIDALRAKGCTCLWQGEFVAAREHFERALELLGEEPLSPTDSDFMEDRLVFTLFHLSWALWFLGLPDRALRLSHEAVERARQLRQPFSEAAALVFRTFLRQVRREVEETLAVSRETIRLAEGYPFWLAAARILEGWALAMTKEPEQGVRLTKEGIEAWKATETGAASTYYYILLVEALVVAGQFDAAREALAEAASEMRRRGERAFEAEIHRLEGELIWRAALSNKQSIPYAEIESAFRRALETAERQEAPSLALKAAAALVELDRDRVDPKSGAEVKLRAAYDSFTEGFDTPGLRHAANLLAQGDSG
jgi:serine/threonine protein kinase/tetratricopeptide (TPR) repeat protein